MDFNIYDDHLQKLNVTKEIVDEEQSSTKYGKRIFTKDYIQKYEGQFLYNNFHGQGKYTWISPDGNGNNYSLDEQLNMSFVVSFPNYTH